MRYGGATHRRGSRHAEPCSGRRSASRGFVARVVRMAVDHVRVHGVHYISGHEGALRAECRSQNSSQIAAHGARLRVNHAGTGGPKVEHFYPRS